MANDANIELQASERRQPTVLIVEDEVIIRISLSEYLQDCEFTVFGVSNAHEAQAILNGGRHVDVVFTDVHMPGEMDGFALARWVRTNYPSVRVILTSGVARIARDAADLCDQADFVPKPYDHHQLADRIKSAIAKQDRFAP